MHYILPLQSRMSCILFVVILYTKDLRLNVMFNVSAVMLLSLCIIVKSWRCGEQNIIHDIGTDLFISPE